MSFNKMLFVLLAAAVCLAGCQKVADSDKTDAVKRTDAQSAETQHDEEWYRLEEQYRAERQLESDLHDAAVLRLGIITDKIRSDSREEKADGIEELYRLLANPDIFGSVNDYIDLMTEEDLKLVQNGRNLRVNFRFDITLYKKEDGTYYAEAKYNRDSPEIVSELFVKAVKEGDENAVFENLMTSEDVNDGASALRKLKETGKYDQIIRTKTNEPDGSNDDPLCPAKYGTRCLTTYTLDDGSYYDVYLCYMGEKGYMVECF